MADTKFAWLLDLEGMILAKVQAQSIDQVEITNLQIRGIVHDLESKIVRTCLDGKKVTKALIQDLRAAKLEAEVAYQQYRRLKELKDMMEVLRPVMEQYREEKAKEPKDPYNRADLLLPGSPFRPV